MKNFTFIDNSREPQMKAMNPLGGFTTESVVHGQCNARLTVITSVTDRRHPLVSTKLYCLVTGTRICKLLAQRWYVSCDSEIIIAIIINEND